MPDLAARRLIPVVLRGLALCGLALAVGSGAPHDCAPGVVQACACHPHATGTQACTADGLGFGACDCVCDAGFVPDATGQCVAAACSAGEVQACAGCGLGALGQQSCAADRLSWQACQCSCPSGFSADAQGDCVPSCAEGTRWQTGGVCAAAARGNLTFLWTFAGATCAQAGIEQVQVEVSSKAGPAALAQNGLYACSSAGADGIVLLRFAGGDYAWRLTGLDAGGVAQYAVSGTATVDGDATVHASLAR